MERHNMTSLKCIASAAAPLSPVVAERFIKRLMKQGADVKLIQGNVSVTLFGTRLNVPHVLILEY